MFVSVSDELNMLIQDPSAPSCLFGAPHTTRFTLDWSRAPAHLREREEDVGGGGGYAVQIRLPGRPCACVRERILTSGKAPV